MMRVIGTVVVALVLVGSGATAGARGADRGALGTWTVTATLDPGRWGYTATLAPTGYTATLLPTGKVLVAGGCCDASHQPLASAEVYDPSSGTWAATGSMTTPRAYHTATLLPDGRVLVAGGQAPSSVVLASAELYDPRSGRWTATASMAAARAGQSALVLRSGKVLVAGGADAAGNRSLGGEIYDPVSETWSPTGPLRATGPTSFTTCDGPLLPLPTGKALLLCGPAAQLFDPATKAWALTGSAAARHSSATVLADGTVVYAGGQADASYCTRCFADSLSSVEVYNAHRGHWAAAPDMAVGRDGQSATLLPTGDVLIAGGVDGDNRDDPTPVTYMAYAELYNPGGGGRMTGPLHVGRAHQTAVLLATGQVLVFGGVASDRGALADAELYNAPALAASTAVVRVGQPMTVTGAGLPTTAVTLRWDTALGASATTTRVSLMGLFAAQARVPAMPGGPHRLVAVGPTTWRATSVSVRVAPALTLPHAALRAGALATLSGTGFGGREAVTLWWDSGPRRRLGTAMTTAQGLLSPIVVRVPQGMRGRHRLYGVGQRSHLQAVAVLVVE